jgi:beta-glucosidase
MNEEKTTTKFEEEPKHFALYGASESGRDYNTVDMSRLRMLMNTFSLSCRC